MCEIAAAVTRTGDALEVDFARLARKLPRLHRQPIARRILLENLVRYHQGTSAVSDQIAAIAQGESIEIAFRPARVLMQDYAGMPVLIDLAALRSEAHQAGYNPASINPRTPVDLVVDHSVMANATRRPDALALNLQREFAENAERYVFLKWAQQAFDRLRIIPPGQGIVHQVNTEFLATVVEEGHAADDLLWRFPDTVIGTDSHTTMVNGLGVLGWGVGGIEAEAVMLGEPVSMIVPAVAAVRLEGRIATGVLATDVVLSLTEYLRGQGVVGKIIEFCGPGVQALSAADRLTIANMAPEFGATAAFFPVDERTLEYLRTTGRSIELIARVDGYLKRAKLFYDPDFQPDAESTLRFNLGAVGKVVAGPKRPDQRRSLSDLPGVMVDLLRTDAGSASVDGLAHGDIVIASITSCTNTANPEAMITAALLARNARRYGLTVRPKIKTSLAPGSRVVADYLERLGLMEDLSALGFDVVAFGCTTCVGNSGDLEPSVVAALDRVDLTVASVLSGNRNFEGRIHPRVKANFLASPPLVIAYALAGTMQTDLSADPLGVDIDGRPVKLTDLWPAPEEVSAAMAEALKPERFRASYQRATEGAADWAKLSAPRGPLFRWSADSRYIRKPPFFDQKPAFVSDAPLLAEARPLLLLGDFVTTDHISPVGRIAPDSPAADYLRTAGISESEFNAYGARRGEHEVMARGTFANARLQNRFVDRPGGWTRIMPEDKVVSVFECAQAYRDRGDDIVIIAGSTYGAGSARDWAAKGTRLLGIKAIIAESFERIHRANLVRMGVLPLRFAKGMTAKAIGVGPTTRITVDAKPVDLSPFGVLTGRFESDAGPTRESKLVAEIETLQELDYLCAGGILPYVAQEVFGKAPADA